MKSPILILAITFLCLAAHTTQAIPADVAQLIQDDKYAEALARVDELLKTKPDDAELLALKPQLQKSLPAAPAKAAEGSSMADFAASFGKSEDASLSNYRDNLAKAEAAAAAPVIVAQVKPVEKPSITQAASKPEVKPIVENQAASGPSESETIRFLNGKLEKGEYCGGRLPSGDTSWVSKFQIALNENGLLTVSHHHAVIFSSGTTIEDDSVGKVEKWGEYPDANIFTTNFIDKAGSVIYAAIIGSPKDESDKYHKWVILPCESEAVAERVVKALKHLSALSKGRKEAF